MRFPVQYCPYCGEQDLRPAEEPHGAWTCADCRSTFVVTAARTRSAAQPDPSASTGARA